MRMTRMQFHSTILTFMFLWQSCSTLQTLVDLDMDGRWNHYGGGDDCHEASKDFGNRYRSMPSAVVNPKSVTDISRVVEFVYGLGVDSNLTVAARGHGHSLHGQAQAAGGVVVMMEAMAEEHEMIVHAGEDPHVDVSGGVLWIDVLKETLKSGLAPKSWTDYLHLTVGGTLSNAGISGQAFRHGPQISNVKSLQVVTGKGEVVDCSPEKDADLFFAVLGGLGQFGIITRARIALQPAPKMVKWMRVLYSDIDAFIEDQEMLISKENTFDYIEGFVIKNREGLVNNWRAFLNPQDPFKANQFESQGRTLYCLEMTKNFDPIDVDNVNQEISTILSQLGYINSTLFHSEVSYMDFLNRVHLSELKLRTKGLWDVPHPWLNLMIPRSRIRDFSRVVFGKILADNSHGPILIYPVKKSKWDDRTSAVTPEEEIFYMVAFLSSVPSLMDGDGLEFLLKRNHKILGFCQSAGIQMKQYLPHYSTREEWKAHFGNKWRVFERRKLAYDPLAILAPGQQIFRKATRFSDVQTTTYKQAS